MAARTKPLAATQSHQLLATTANVWYGGDTYQLAIDLDIAGLVTTSDAAPPSRYWPDDIEALRREVETVFGVPTEPHKHPATYAWFRLVFVVPKIIAPWVRTGVVPPPDAVFEDRWLREANPSHPAEAGRAVYLALADRLEAQGHAAGADVRDAAG